MSRSRKALIAVLGIVAAFALAAFTQAAMGGGLVSRVIWPDDEQSPAHTVSVDQTVTSGPLTIRLTEVDLSATRTRASLEISNANLPDAKQRSVMLHQHLIRVDGVESRGDDLVISYRMADADTVLYTLEFGPASSPNTPITITIDKIWALESESSGSYVDGPWVFQLTPGGAAVDPLARVIEVDRSKSADQKTIFFDQVRTSSDEVIVAYNFSSPENLLGPASAPALMVFPDGSFAPGLPLNRAPDDTGSLLLSFPPLPNGATTFEIRFGPYLTDTPGSYTFEIDLPPTVRSADPSEEATLIVGQQFEIRNESVEVSDIRIEPDGFTLRFAPPSGTSVEYAGMSQADNIYAVDDLGNTYFPEIVEGGFGKDDQGNVFFREDVVRFAPALDPQAESLKVRVSSFAALDYGPWDFQVSVAE
ncbi:MAG: hypothetical protein WD379_07100 [Dehalococcoidia bacterium]